MVPLGNFNQNSRSKSRSMSLSDKRGSCGGSRTRSGKCINRSFSMTPQSAEQLIQIPQMWQHGSPNGHISVNLPNGSTILLQNQGGYDQFMRSRNSQSIKTFDNNDINNRSREDEFNSCYYTQPINMANRSLSFDNYQQLENHVYQHPSKKAMRIV